MILKLFFCQDEDYSTEFIECEVKHQIIYHPTKGNIEVALDTSPPVFGHSKNNQKFNIMLYDVDLGKNNELVQNFVFEKNQIYFHGRC